MRLVPFQPTQAAAHRLTFIAPVSLVQSLKAWADRQRTSREGLFEELDGEVIRANGCSWRIRVYSICEELGAARWLQLSLDGDPEYAVTMRTSAFQTAQDTIARLSDWLSNRPLADDTVTVA